MRGWLAVDFRMKIVIGCAVVVILAATMSIVLRPHSYEFPSFSVEMVEKLTVDEVVARFDPSGTLLLPTWMPGQLELQEIYLPSQVIVLAYGDVPIEHDIIEAKVCIELKRSNRTPTLEELKNQTSAEILEIGSFLVVVVEDAFASPKWVERGLEPLFAYFYHDGFYYLIGTRKGEYTRDDLIRIVENMKPVGPETLRKS